MKYKSEEVLCIFRESLEKYPANLLPESIPPKIEARVRKACEAPCEHNYEMDIYDLQLIAMINIENIMVSHLLGENEVVIPHLIAEYGALKTTLDLLNVENAKRFKQFQGLNGCIPLYKTKKISSLLFDDLTQLCEEYKIEYDIKYAVKCM